MSGNREMFLRGLRIRKILLQWNGFFNLSHRRRRKECTLYLQLYDYRVLKEVVVLVNESTIRCNEYLNALIKLEEIVRTQTKKVDSIILVDSRDLSIPFIQIAIISI